MQQLSIVLLFVLISTSNINVATCSVNDNINNKIECTSPTRQSDDGVWSFTCTTPTLTTSSTLKGNNFGEKSDECTFSCSLSVTTSDGDRHQRDGVGSISVYGCVSTCTSSTLNGFFYPSVCSCAPLMDESTLLSTARVECTCRWGIDSSSWMTWTYRCDGLSDKCGWRQAVTEQKKQETVKHEEKIVVVSPQRTVMVGSDSTMETIATSTMSKMVFKNESEQSFCEWSGWGEWSPAAEECKEIRRREKTCSCGDVARCGVAPFEEKACLNISQCVFGEWSDWTLCSGQCDGLRYRKQKCQCGDELTPDMNCKGVPLRQSEVCNAAASTQGCCEWHWTDNWSNCTTCSAPRHTPVSRHRRQICMCSGKEAHNEQCSRRGPFQEDVQLCQPTHSEEYCPNWNHHQWNSWSVCSVTHGEGTRFRTKKCDDRSLLCSGSTPLQIESCFPAVGRWKESQPTRCDVDCGVGGYWVSKECVCDGDTPCDISFCVGIPFNQQKLCRGGNCPSNCSWEETQTECSGRCPASYSQSDEGHIIITRRCKCSGVSVNNEYCSPTLPLLEKRPCKRDCAQFAITSCVWMGWSYWTICEQEQQTRSRDCSCPTSSSATGGCKGPSSEERFCVDMGVKRDLENLYNVRQRRDLDGGSRAFFTMDDEDGSAFYWCLSVVVLFVVLVVVRYYPKHTSNEINFASF